MLISQYFLLLCQINIITHASVSQTEYFKSTLFYELYCENKYATNNEINNLLSCSILYALHFIQKTY